MRYTHETVVSRHGMIAGLAAALFCVASPMRHASGDDGVARAPLDVVREAARWIAEQARAVDGAPDTADFPEYAEEPDERPLSLYAGTPGVLVFLENAAAVTGDAELRALADRTANGLVARMGKTAEGHPTWTTGTRPASVGLYTGDAGVGHAFLVRARIRDNDEALSVARRVGDGVLARATQDGDVCSWDSTYDIIGGAAGTLLFLLELGETTDDDRYLRGAVAAGRWLAREAHADDTGLWWPPRAGSTRHYPHFSHGTSGIAYALARRVALTTDDDICRAAAVKGGSWLLAHADRDADAGTVTWCHYTPGHEDRFMEGWCHGPSGTTRTFLALHALTGEQRYRDTALATARWILKTKPGPGSADSRVRFYSPSLCCGAAGVLDCMIDVARSTGDPAARAYCQEVSRYLQRLAKTDEDGLKWTNYDRPDENGVIFHSTSLMLGAAGEAFSFLRLAVLDQDTEPIVHLPDRRVTFDDSKPRPAPQPVAAESNPSSDEPIAYDALRGRAQKLWNGENRADGRYVVLLQEDSGLEGPAATLALHRDAEIITFSPAAPELLLDTLIDKSVRYAAIFVEPDAMDVNLLRRFIVLSTLLDADPFCDFAFGFVTASSPDEVAAFVDRMITADREGVPMSTAQWAVSNISHTYAGSSFIEGLPGDSHYVAQGDIDFARARLQELGDAGFVHIGGCGDPEGIWLFDDQRNLDRSKHWPFDPEKVGFDPAGEMPRIGVADLDGLRFDNSVVWTHVCHIGSTSRMFVEGDIVSTFGRADRVEEYRVPAERSVALAIIEAGVSAYIAPLGPNFGAQSDIEQSIASELGLPLGDVLRRVYHDVVMDTDGHPEQIGVYIAGKPARWRPDAFTNHNSPQHRALYGDPLARPFGEARSPATVEIETSEHEGLLVADFRVTGSGWLGRTWYGNRGLNPGRGRIYEVIPLKTDVDAASIVSVTAETSDGQPFDIIDQTALLERLDGKTLLHLQLVTDDADAFRSTDSVVQVTVRLGDAAKDEDVRTHASGDLDQVLDTPWALPRREWTLESFLSFVENFTEEHGETYGLSGTVTFTFADDVRNVRNRSVTIEADHTPLRELLDSICAQLDIGYEVQPDRSTVRFVAKER